MSEDTQYDKKMKYKSTDKNKKIKSVRSSKKNKQNIKNSLRDFSISDCYESCDVDDDFWEDDELC